VSALPRGFAAAAAHYDNMSPPEDEPGLLDDFEEAREFIESEHGESFSDAAYEMVEDWLSGPRDRFAEAKALSALKALAARCVEWCEAEDTRRIEDSFPDGDI
jgi:hypothetical protein